jgi:hypothetical protein
MLEIDEYITRPELSVQFLARHHISGPLEQNRQNMKRLFRDPDPMSMLEQLPRLKIELESPETQALI